MTRLPASIASFALAAGTLPASAAWAQQLSPGFDGRGPHMMGWGGGFGMILGPIFMILVLALVIAVAVLIVRALGGSHGAPARQTSLDILKERFARGEIDKQEFEDRRRTLGD